MSIGSVREIQEQKEGGERVWTSKRKFICGSWKERRTEFWIRTALIYRSEGLERLSKERRRKIPTEASLEDAVYSK